MRLVTLAALVALALGACEGFAQIGVPATPAVVVLPPPPPPPVAASRVVELTSHAYGIVAAVHVAAGQHVRAGDVVVELAAGGPLARLAEATRALDDAEHDLIAATQAVAGIQQAMKLLADPEYQRRASEPDRARLRYAQAAVVVARTDRDRTKRLFDAGAVTRAELDAANAAASAAEAALAQLTRPHEYGPVVQAYARSLEVARTEVELATAAHQTAREGVADARSALDATRVVATASGVVANVLVAPGAVVSRDQPVVHLSTRQP
jgi:multidrug resistance efflux pump